MYMLCTYISVYMVWSLERLASSRLGQDSNPSGFAFSGVTLIGNTQNSNVYGHDRIKKVKKKVLCILGSGDTNFNYENNSKNLEHSIINNKLLVTTFYLL